MVTKALLARPLPRSAPGPVLPVRVSLLVTTEADYLHT